MIPVKDVSVNEGYDNTSVVRCLDMKTFKIQLPPNWWCQSSYGIWRYSREGRERNRQSITCGTFGFENMYIYGSGTSIQGLILVILDLFQEVYIIQSLAEHLKIHQSFL